MRHFIQRILGKGEDDSGTGSGGPTPYEASLRELLESQDHLHIVQVGANDGLLNDPLNEFVQGARDRTTLLLIEPQEHLIPILRENYSFHPSKVIVQGALGPPGELTLYAVSRRYWPRLRSIPYVRLCGSPHP